MLFRKEQNLDPDMDVTPEEYLEAGSLRADYRLTNEDLVVMCDYEFLKGLNKGDIIMLMNEETQNLSPFVLYTELTKYDDNGVDNRLWKVTRKVYSAGSLDVYVIDVDDNDGLDEYL
jgi:hypothetical protein